MIKQQISVLGVQPFLRGIAEAQLAELAELCEHVTIPAGAGCREGSGADGFGVIDAGQVMPTRACQARRGSSWRRSAGAT